MFKGLANLGALVRGAQAISGRMKDLGEELKKRRATGTAGGGMVEVEINGLVEVLRCRIDPQLIAGGDRELIEDLIATAVNQAIQKAKQLHAEAVRALAGDVAVPGLEEAVSKLMGQEGPGE